MLPVKVLRESIGAAFAADTAYLAAASAPKVKLAMADFTASDDLVVGSLTEATFDGYAAKTPTAGAQQVAVDPVTGEQIVTLVEPVGGWRWVSSGVTNLPQTIYGFYLVDNAGTALLGAEKLDTPVTITASGQEINIGRVTFRFVNPPCD